jgi:hypothetical protein
LLVNLALCGIPHLVERFQVSKDLRESLPPTIYNLGIYSHPKSSTLGIGGRSTKEGRSRWRRFKKTNADPQKEIGARLPQGSLKNIGTSTSGVRGDPFGCW